MNIKQYIVGTGGAEFDNIDKSSIRSGFVSEDNLQYKINLEQTIDNKNGFLKCIDTDTDNGDLSFEFIMVDENMSGGRRRRKRTMKRKRKARKTRKYIKRC